MPTLYALNLAKSYKKRRVVIDVSLSVTSGQIVGLLGPNGARISTGVCMTACLIGADTGRVLIDQTDTTHPPTHARARACIAYLPQEASVSRKLSVADNIMAMLATGK